MWVTFSYVFESEQPKGLGLLTTYLVKLVETLLCVCEKKVILEIQKEKFTRMARARNQVSLSRCFDISTFNLLAQKETN